jgi:hypothetical protein
LVKIKLLRLRFSRMSPKRHGPFQRLDFGPGRAKSRGIPRQKSEQRREKAFRPLAARSHQRIEYDPPASLRASSSRRPACGGKSHARRRCAICRISACKCSMKALARSTRRSSPYRRKGSLKAALLGFLTRQRGHVAALRLGPYEPHGIAECESARAAQLVRTAHNCGSVKLLLAHGGIPCTS